MGLIFCPYYIHSYAYLSLDVQRDVAYSMKDTFDKDNVGEYNFFDAFHLYKEALEIHCKNLFDDDVDDLDTSLNIAELYEQTLRLWAVAVRDRIRELGYTCDSFDDIDEINRLFTEYRLAMIDVCDEKLSMFYVQLYEKMAYWECVILDKLYGLKDELDWVAR